jgi:hypothetical protein
MYVQGGPFFSDKLLAFVSIVNVKAITLLGLKPQELLLYAGGLVP